MSGVSFDITGRYLDCCSSTAPAKRLLSDSCLSLYLWHWGICWPSSCVSPGNNLILSKHKPLWARAKKVVEEDPRKEHQRRCHVWMGPSLGLIFHPVKSILKLSLCLMTTLRRDIAWRENTEPDLGLRERRSLQCKYLVSDDIAQGIGLMGFTNTYQASPSVNSLLSSSSILLLAHLFPLQPRQMLSWLEGWFLKRQMYAGQTHSWSQTDRRWVVIYSLQNKFEQQIGRCVLELVDNEGT